MNSSKITYLYPPDNQVNYSREHSPIFLKWQNKSYNWRKTWQAETFVSLMCHWILNVSQVLDIWHYEKVSIPILETTCDEKLSIQEILSDIVLYELITDDNDHSIVLDNDERAKDWNIIKWHNCIIYKEGTYSLFDTIDHWNKIEKEEVKDKIISSIRNILDKEFLADADEWYHYFEWFFDRMLLNVNEFLNNYDWEEWRSFFLRQVVKARDYNTIPKDLKKKDDIWFDEDIERYENLIFTLKNIKEVISVEDIEGKMLDYMWTDYTFIKNEVELHLTKVRELLARLW